MRAAILIASILATLTVVADGQSREVSRLSGSMRASPTTAAVFSTHGDDQGVQVLDVLVLWRGRPAWFLNGGFGTTDVAGSAPSAVTRLNSWASFGQANFTATFDLKAGTGMVLGQAVSLRGANVVLVDGIGEATQPTVVGTRLVAPRLPSSKDAVSEMIRNTPELMEYLRCGVAVPFPDKAVQSMVAGLCAAARPYAHPTTTLIFPTVEGRHRQVISRRQYDSPIDNSVRPI